ncbi:Intersectin-1 like protein [Rozella allomycis CSF55]|uniref:Intersectin-1 like protein n=1 Tax=Rozella allomycis (strain CSF55) TaxID=988480 RepID=A0A075ATF4_ROZAC|nr:Intersectin-1 like protein [Rozella allomycis CSF55]|eukprot:EPZ31817.1 Intersectin-1 like protein [Rozella allomycis CSF55]
MDTCQGKRGKLNCNEFCVAMELITRAIGGVPVPGVLPGELVVELERPCYLKTQNEKIKEIENLIKSMPVTNKNFASEKGVFENNLRQTGRNSIQQNMNVEIVDKIGGSMNRSISNVKRDTVKSNVFANKNEDLKIMIPLDLNSSAVKTPTIQVSFLKSPEKRLSSAKTNSSMTRSISHLEFSKDEIFEDPFVEDPFQDESERFEEFSIIKSFESEEISLKVGDVINADMKHPEVSLLWWFGYKKNSEQVGWFPSICVQRMFKAKANFSKKNDDELDLKIGDILVLLREEDDGWVCVENERLESGYVPLNFLSEIKNVERMNFNSRPRSLSFNQIYSYNIEPEKVSGWSDFVGSEISESVSKEERKRQEAIFELIATERKYVADLQLIIQVFYSPLLKILNVTTVEMLFSNIEDILLVNCQLLSDLDDLQKNEFPIVNNLGKIMLRHKCLTDPRCRNLQLSSFLLQPMQRVTRYPLLLKQIIHYTQKDCLDHKELLEALFKSEELLKRVNEAAREKENLEKIKELSLKLETNDLQEPLDLLSMTKYVGKRRIIKEGYIFKAKSNRKLYAILFNDLLIFTEQISIRSLFKPLPLDEIVVREVQDPKMFSSYNPCWFQIVHIKDILTIKSPDLQEKRMWFNEIEEAIKQIRLAEKHSMSKSSLNFKCIGTVQVCIREAKDLLFTAIVQNSNYPKWNQSLMFSVETLDSNIRFIVYHYDRYGQNTYLGQCEIQLDFLEYYGEKETEIIELSLKDVPKGSLLIQLQYHST